MKIIFLCLLVSSCREDVSVDPGERSINETLILLMKEAINNSYDQIPGVTMAIISPYLEEEWSGVVGYDSKNKEDTLSIDQPFRIASITKSFVAISILRLHEMDSLSIDEPISQYISEEHIEILKMDQYDADEILIRHCLNHTSGLFDYAANHDKYIEACTKDPLRRWTRTEQLEGAIKWGDKAGEPGERYLYSDTGYILLGEIIESFFDGDLAKGLRELLKFDQLGLTKTWLESLEPAPDDHYKPVRRYLGSLDATDWDASIDLYGGGGLISTAPELADFINALFGGKVFTKPETLALMQVAPDYHSSYIPSEDSRFKDYRYGLWSFNIYGEQAFMHSGLWGTHMIHIPAYETSIAVNYTKGRNHRMIKKVILAIKKLKEDKHL